MAYSFKSNSQDHLCHDRIVIVYTVEKPGVQSVLLLKLSSSDTELQSTELCSCAGVSVAGVT